MAPTRWPGLVLVSHFSWVGAFSKHHRFASPLRPTTFAHGTSACGCCSRPNRRQDVLASHPITELLRWAHKKDAFYFEFQPEGGEEPSDILMFDTTEVWTPSTIMRCVRAPWATLFVLVCWEQHDLLCFLRITLFHLRACWFTPVLNTPGRNHV